MNYNVQIIYYNIFQKFCLSFGIWHYTNALIYREDQHGPCARMTRIIEEKKALFFVFCGGGAGWFGYGTYYIQIYAQYMQMIVLFEIRYDSYMYCIRIVSRLLLREPQNKYIVQVVGNLSALFSLIYIHTKTWVVLI